MAILTQIRGIISRALPVALSDNTEVNPRVTRYSELVNPLLPRQLYADDGCYFVTTNPTPNTVLAYGSAGTQATFSDTVPFMQIKNTAGTNGRRAYLDFLKIIHRGGTAPATTTEVHYAVKIDNIDRTATAGTPVVHTPVNANMDDATGSVCRVTVFTGAVATIPASSAAARLVSHGMLKGGPILSLDEYNIIFGAGDNASQAGYLTTVSGYCSRSAPVVLGPGQVATIYLWALGATTNPISYEYELGVFER